MGALIFKKQGIKRGLVPLFFIKHIRYKKELMGISALLLRKYIW